eukprot:13748566-Alexandrium_andersonii.AAC.1
MSDTLSTPETAPHSLVQLEAVFGCPCMLCTLVALCFQPGELFRCVAEYRWRLWRWALARSQGYPWA